MAVQGSRRAGSPLSTTLAFCCSSNSRRMQSSPLSRSQHSHGSSRWQRHSTRRKCWNSCGGKARLLSSQTRRRWEARARVWLEHPPCCLRYISGPDADLLVPGPQTDAGYWRPVASLLNP